MSGFSAQWVRFSTIACLILALVGCGGSDGPPMPVANQAAASKPQAPPVKSKNGQLIESEDNTPANFRDRDN